MPNFDDLSENELLNDQFHYGSEDEKENDENNENKEDKKKPEMVNLYVDPNIPLKFLFQLSAFSIDYLKQKGKKRFPFLGGDRIDVGKALLPRDESADKKDDKESLRAKDDLKEESKRSSRRGNRSERRRHRRN